MGLIAGDRALLMAPVNPIGGEFVQQQVVNGLAVIAAHTGDAIGLVFAEQGGEFESQIVAPALLELVEQIVGPVGE